MEGVQMRGPIMININITNLIINLENPRFDPVDNQREAIQKMIKEIGDKIYNLAEDIAQFGLNPTELVIVKEMHNKENMYLVLEGNRRITALKLLNQPSILNNIDAKMYKKFQELHMKYQDVILKTVKCIVFKNEEEAYKWIELRHTGENDGVGVLKWDTKAQERFKEKRGSKSETLQIIDFIKSSDAFSEEVKNKVDSIRITNLKRLIDDPDVRNAIGLDKENGVIKTFLPDSEVAKGLSRIINDLVDDKINVKDIYYKEDRLNYIKTFSKDDLPNTSKLLSKSRDILNTNENLQKQISDKSTYENEKENNEKKKTGEKRKSTDRKYLIPSDFVITVTKGRINDIYKELKKLEVESFTNSVSVLFRVFIELSADEFIEKLKFKDVDKDSKLKYKVQKIAEYMKKNNYLDKYQLKPIYKSISSNNNILSIDTFNAYVHNKDFYPSPNDLKLTWNNMQLFIRKIWQILLEMEE